MTTTSSLLKELETFPKLWKKITNSSSYPDVESMISLLKEAGFQLETRPSGSTCIKTIHQYKFELEAFLEKNGTPPIDSSTEEEALEENKEEQSTSTETSTEESLIKQETFNDFHTFPFDPDSQCEFTLEAEAIERIKFCIGTSFRTDAGLIMLENDLALYEEIDPTQLLKWIQDMKEAWKNRLHSKIYPEFEEAFDLWVAAKQK
jgi:hypothetical protein